MNTSTLTAPGVIPRFITRHARSMLVGGLIALLLPGPGMAATTTEKPPQAAKSSHDNTSATSPDVVRLPAPGGAGTRSPTRDGRR
jgi:hypothetical protein